MPLRISIVTLAALCALVAPTFAGAASAGDDVLDPPRLPGLLDLGSAPANERVTFAATLAYRNETELENLAVSQSDPGSPLFGRFVSNAQFNAYFAPAPSAYARTIAILRQAGFSVTRTFGNRSVVDVAGSVAAADRFFATDLHWVRQPGFGLRLANRTPVRLPAALHGLVTSIAGLQTVVRVKPAIATAGPHVSPAWESTPWPLYGPVSTVTGLPGFGPLAFSAGYDLPVRHATSGHPLDGRGRTSAVVIDADFLDSDLASFLAYFHVKRSGPRTLRILVDGGPPTGDIDPDSLETTLDVETIVSNAPGTALVVYESPDLADQSITDAYEHVVDDNRVDSANSSFGGCEDGAAALVRSWDQLALQGAVKGITFHASSGDAGSDPCGDDGLEVSAPADGPHVAAIGGTTLDVTRSGAYVSEVAWNSDGGATGGGVSDVFPLPSWQAGIRNVIPTGRNVPDVAFDADPNTGAAYYYGGTWNTPYDPLGGTSLSSPIFGAAVAEIDESLDRRTGLTAVLLYRFAKEHGYRGPHAIPYFHDIVAGCNGIGGNAGFCAKPGFDQVSGIGSLDVWNERL